MMSIMSSEHVDNSEVQCPLGMVTTSVDRRCGSASPSSLRHVKQDGIKSSSTEPQLSSRDTDVSQDGSVRYLLMLFAVIFTYSCNTQRRVSE